MDEARVWVPLLELPEAEKMRPGVWVQPGHHEPTPYVAPGLGGVKCSCGEDFAIGRPADDTAKGSKSKRKIRTMRGAWDAYRVHWRPDGGHDGLL
jgi:hypothetical protein